MGCFIIALSINTYSTGLIYVAAALLLGFISYGLSIFFYIKAQRELGAARTGSYYAAAPFIGAGLSFIFFKQPVTLIFVSAAAIMMLGTYFCVSEDHKHRHVHKALIHEHRHSHDDGHHNHMHEGFVKEHSHEHSHEYIEHDHSHTPDPAHIHSHKASK